MTDISKKIKNSLLKSARPCDAKEQDFVVRYLGTRRKFLCVKSPERDKILRQTVKEIKDFETPEITKILDDLILSDTFEYVNFAGKLLAISDKAREAVEFKHLEKWLALTSGWAECDSICQSLYSEKEVLEMWDEWQKIIRKFSKSKNIQLRRASLVLQVKPNGKSNDPRFRKLAFEIIDKLKDEKSVLITKAISWLLRAVSNENKSETLQYLQENKEALPKIAYRETMKKIETGKK